MIFNNFFYKLKKDISRLGGYPVDKLAWFSVDYDYYWNRKRPEVKSTLSDWQKQRADLVLKMVEPGSTVIDFGCGDGSVLKYLKDRANIDGIGIDISEEALKKAKTIGIEVIKIDINNFNEFSNLPEVDYIFGFEIIEHLPNPEEFIAKIKDKAKRALILSVPNTGYWSHRFRLLFGRFPLQWLAHPSEHLRFWTVEDMKWWVASLGLKLDEMVIYEGLPGLNNLFPKLFGQGIIIKISKK